MATLSLRIRDDLKRKAQDLARRQGVSLNNFVNATIAASVAQEETIRFFDERLQGVGRAALHERVLEFMADCKPGDGPTPEQVQETLGN